MNRFQYFLILFAFTTLFGSCEKDSTVSEDSLYMPSITDITPNATLQELLQGRDRYISYCNRCHGYYLPESHTPAEWKNIMGSMAPKANLSSSDSLLIIKYLCKGKQ